MSGRLGRTSRALAVILLFAGVAVLAQGVPPPPPPPPPPLPPGVQGRDAPARPQVGTARLTGVIVANDAAAQPIRRAIMLLNGGGLVIARQTTTDDDGRFVFSALPAGRYTIQAWRSGFVRDMYGNKRPGMGAGAPIIVGDGQRVDITMKMTRAAAITGTILPSAAAPTSSMWIQAMQYQTVGGERRLIPARTGGVSPNSGMSGLVDDRGVYRIYGLAPGEYVISTQVFSSGDIRAVTPAEVEWAAQQFRPAPPGSIPSGPPPPARPMGYSPVYYPGTTDPTAATTITVGAGEERRGIDFALQLVPVAKVEGSVVGQSGQLPQNAQLTLMPSGVNAALRQVNAPVRATPDGKFTATGVTPGRYTLTARALASVGAAPTPAPGVGRGGGPTGPILWGSLDFDVDGRDLTDLVVVLQPGVTVSGRVVFEGSPPPTAPTVVRLSLSPVQQNMFMGATPSGAQAADGTFAVSGVAPGLYRMAAFLLGPTGPTAWTLKSALLEGRDLLDDAVEIRPGQGVNGVVVTFTDRPTRLSGSLLDAGGQPTSEYFILVFSTERRFWMPGSRRVAQARPDNTGAFSFPTLAAGEYYVCAVTDLDPSEMYETAFLEPLISGSMKVTLAEGEQKIHSMKLVGRFDR